MNISKSHIIYKISAVILILALLTPSIVKFSHIFEDHIHNVCKNPQKTHFHEFDLDCDFYSFKLNTPFCFTPQDLQFLVINKYNQIATQQYLFVSNGQNLHFFKRGPPQLI